MDVPSGGRGGWLSPKPLKATAGRFRPRAAAAARRAPRQRARQKAVALGAGIYLHLAGFEHPILGAGFEAASVGEPDRERAPYPGVRRPRRRHQPDAPAEGADLRVAECGLVKGFGVARLAVKRHATQNGMLYCASIKWGSRMLWRSIMRSLPVTVIASTSGPLQPCGLRIAHRSDRGVRVAWHG